jgi:microsomal dipeptidase-like Zn-dependent dipeptidase
MRVRLKKILLWFSLAVVALLVAASLIVPAQVEKRMNVTLLPPPYRASARAEQLHRALTVADLHADSLLWDRDLLTRGTRGHVDVPRLIEGNVAIQAFTVVTKVPRGLNIERNEDATDIITWLAIAQRWPPRTWTSLTQRALYQAQRLRRAAERSGGTLVILRNAGDLDAFLARRQTNRNLVAGLLGIEGAHALDGDLANLDALFDAGFRMMAPTHFFDTDIGGSAHGVRKGGLTEMGREMIRRMEAKGMILDLAHASPQVLDEALALAKRPVVVSHSGVKGTCNNRRNLSDEHLRGIARTGGVVGIGYWETAVCGADARAIARAIRYAADLIGVEYVALGSDFDGAIPAPFDTTGLAQITEALLNAGFSESQIRLIMGENVVRVLRQTLPK